MRNGHRALRRHLLALSALGLAIGAVAADVLPAHPATLLLPLPLFLAAFAAAHDAMHGSLSVSRRLRESLLALFAALMLTSGHALRVGHLVHHRRPLEGDDLEGAAAKLPLWRAILAAPGLMIGLRRMAWRRASAAERRWQIAETIANAATAVALAASGIPVLQAWLVFALALLVFMPVWAGHIPHRAPAWLIALARKAAVTGSPTALSLAYHELHHDHPKVPTAFLHALAEGRGALAAAGRPAVGWPS